MTFSGKSVLVAGGTGGLGRAVSIAFLNEGAEVLVTYRNEQEFEELKNLVGGGGSGDPPQAWTPAPQNASRLVGRKVDVTDPEAVRELIQGILAEKGRLDALVNTVGGFAGGKKLWDTDARALDQMLALNVRAGFVLARAAAMAMLPQKRGAIVNIASKAGVDHEGGIAVYAASKAAALALMDSLAADLKGSGVRVNSVLPSIFDTEANRKAMPHADFAKWPKPEDIARVILFLCSDEAKVIHGAAIPVYGND